MRHACEDPRLVILILAIIVVGGVTGFVTRASREDPLSRVRWGYVTTRLPGAEPLEVEALVTEPIERTLREAGAVRSIESSSLRGVSLVFIRLTDEVTDVRGSWSKIQDKLSEVAGQLPPRATPPLLADERQWGSHTHIVSLCENGDESVSVSVLARWAKELNSRLSFVSGTRFTEVFGLPVEEILVEIDEQTIAASNMTLQEIASRIRARDAEGGDALSQSQGHSMPISLTGDVDSLGRLRELMLRGDSKDRQLRLGDLATIRRGEHQPRSQSAFVRGRRAVVIATRMDDSYGIDSWTKRQQEVLDEFEASLPAQLSLVTIFSQKKYTDDRALNLYANLGMGMILVVVVVLIMMGWRATIPICAALPLTLCLVFFLMTPFGISLHQMSIAGLILALGMLIDNPIIVVDDVQRRLNAGVPAIDAFQQSIRRLTTPLLGSNVTTILGFVPILLIGGPTGEFMEQLGWAVIACLIGSLFLSLSIIPILAAWVLRPTSLSVGTAQDAPGSKFSLPGGLVSRYYFQGIRKLLKFPLLLVALTSVVPALGFLSAPHLPEQFFPVAERDHFHFSIRLPTHLSIGETEIAAMRARQIVMQHSEVEDVEVFVGRSAPKLHYSMVALEDNRPNFAQGLVQLNTSPVPVRLIRQIQKELDEQLPHAQCIVTLIEQGPPSPAPIEFRLYGPSVERLDELGQQARALLMQVPGVIHTRASLDPGGPVFAVEVDQNEAEKSGLSDEMISQQFRHRVDGIVATQLSEEIEEIPIRVLLKNRESTDFERVVSQPMVTLGPDPKPVSFGSVARLSVEQQVFSIYRRNSSRCNIIYAYVGAGELPVAVEKKFISLMQKSDFQLPPTYKFDFGGVSSERDAAVGNFVAYSAVVVTLAVAVLVLTFGSFRMAAIISVVAMMSVGLGFLSLWLFAYPIGIISIIGIAGMMGLAINDSIVVLSECQMGAKQCHTIEKSVFDATRHVLTTSVTTVAGVLPLILQGGVFWPPMMIVIAGGVVGATVIALGFTPACYRLATARPKTRDP